MTRFSSRLLPAKVYTVRPLMLMCLLVAGCSSLVFQPAPVVPTNSPLPCSAKVKLSQVEAYMVKPGATMSADPYLEDHVTGLSNSLGNAKKEWEKSIADYLAARKTFTYLSMDSQTDLELTMRLHIYIDPGVQYKFNHVYLARIDTTLTDPRTGRLNHYLGLGKSAGDVARGGNEDDQGPINSAVQSALNDLFGKIENDLRRRQ
jgi:hypothetical protein